jgi:hypothetical protein
MKENRWLVKPVKKMVGKKRRDIIESMPCNMREEIKSVPFISTFFNFNY